MDDLFSFIALHLKTIIFLHILISILLAVVVSIFLIKRYVKTSKLIKAKDKKRFEEIQYNSLYFRLLFKVSLHKNNQITIFFFIFIFNIAVPIVGYFFTLWITWYFLNVSYETKVENTNTLNLDEFGMSFLKIERVFGEGSMGDLMTSEYAPRSKKLKALSSLANNISPVNLQIVRQTLSSTDDEIRMYGYAVINKAETSLNQKINRQLDILREEGLKGNDQDELLMAKTSKELAFLYWEMIYTELSHESLKQSFMNSVITYIQLAKDYYEPKLEELKNSTIADDKSDDVYQALSSIYLLMGRLYMNQGKFEDAKIELTVAVELVPDEATHLLPYLAEVYFETGNYTVVKSLLSKNDSLELNSTLFPIIQQWKTA